MKRPVVTSVLGASGVIIGHTGWAPGRKCDPAALGLCVAQRLPSGTSVTAPIQLRITFVVLFFVSIVYGHLCLNKGTAPSIWHFCRCCLETVRQASTWCFSSWFLFSQEFKSSWVTDAAGIHKFFLKAFSWALCEVFLFTCTWNVMFFIFEIKSLFQRITYWSHISQHYLAYLPDWNKKTWVRTKVTSPDKSRSWLSIP